MKKDGRPRCSLCGRILTDPVSIALGIGPKCRGATGSHGRARMPGKSARRGRAYADPLYSTTLFTVTIEPDDNEKKRRRALLLAHLPLVCGDVTFYPLEDGSWQSSGGSRVFGHEELERSLTEAGMI